MSWADRIQEAAYTSPTGLRLAFEFEDVQRAVDKKTTVFDFPDANGSYVQEHGHAGRQYPVRAFFSGDNCDLAADAFEALLLEPGHGRLDHPLYGTVRVVPTGTITRSDALATAANQSVVEVVFWETITTAYPAGSVDPSTAALAALEAYNAALAAQYGRAVDSRGPTLFAALRGSYLSALSVAKKTLRAVADAQASVQQTFDEVDASINAGITVLVGTPVTLAFQTAVMLQAPARSIAAIRDRLRAYRDLARSIMDGNGAAVPSARGSNDFHTARIFASLSVSGAVLSAVHTQFVTKPEALAAAREVLDQFGAVDAWQEAGTAALGQIDTGEAYQQLQRATALVAGHLVEISFTLKQERKITLDRPRTIIDLSAELYGDVSDASLDYLIATNALTGDEIIELPRGRAIVYYV